MYINESTNQNITPYLSHLSTQHAFVYITFKLNHSMTQYKMTTATDSFDPFSSLMTHFTSRVKNVVLLQNQLSYLVVNVSVVIHSKVRGSLTLQEGECSDISPSPFPFVDEPDGSETEGDAHKHDSADDEYQFRVR